MEIFIATDMFFRQVAVFIQEVISMGRKPVPEAHKRSERLVIMLTTSEAQRVEEAAQAAGAASISDFVRSRILK